MDVLQEPSRAVVLNPSSAWVTTVKFGRKLTRCLDHEITSSSPPSAAMCAVKS